MLKLREIKVISGKVKLLTGLHIGSGNTEMQIGGVDNLVIKHPYTNEPYIPGSSLKGKIRSLLELYYGIPTISYQVNDKMGGLAHHEMLKKKNEITQDVLYATEKILKIFGQSGSAEESIRDLGPTRVAFSDCFFTEEHKNRIKELRLPYTEIKAENRINRITGTAEHPRHTERVPAGSEFEFQITFKILQEGDEELFDELLKGMKLLELDYLGGSGSRGYGKVKFEISDPKIRERLEKITLF
ncbi:MAG: type III-A CRISPR-associated RAMP protein Csm3 [Candidatus Kryptonium sp.]